MHYAHVVAHHVVVAELDQSSGEADVQEIQMLGRKSLLGVTNVIDVEQVPNLLEANMKKFDCIDVLVNNVEGGDPMCPGVSISDEQWDWFIRLNPASGFLAR